MSKLVLNRILTVFVFSLFMIQLAKPQHLLSVLASSDSLTNATVKIHQSEHITDLVFKNETQEQPQEVATSTAPAIKVSDSESRFSLVIYQKMQRQKLLPCKMPCWKLYRMYRYIHCLQCPVLESARGQL
jgi:hypothetical protein